MKSRHAICIVVDGLRASALGCYGNTTFPTPQLNDLSGKSMVVDWLQTDSPSLESFYHTVWHRSHALRDSESQEQSKLHGILQEKGVSQWLVTDDPWLSQQSVELPFAEALLVESHADLAAEELEDTCIAQLFSLAVERFIQWREDESCNGRGSLLWLHSRGLFGPWDAPRSLRRDLLDEEDPPAAEYIEPPSGLRQIEDPDILLAHRAAYAAQVLVLDACIGALNQAIEQSFAGSETLVMLIGSRGFALGEHGFIGADCQELFSEQLHLPWLLHVRGNTVPLARYPGLAQPADIGATLLEWFGAAASANNGDGLSLVAPLLGHPSKLREYVVAGSANNERVLRTPQWLLRALPSSDLSDELSNRLPQLYAKPDDRWEHNDVALRCPDEVNTLHQALNFSCRQLQSKKLLPLQLP